MNKWICTECGHTAFKRFPGDICPRCGMTYWMCDHCGYTIIAGIPPDACTECGGLAGNFTNLTCYIPELGIPDQKDMKLHYS
jgi:rubrerythrin